MQAIGLARGWRGEGAEAVIGKLVVVGQEVRLHVLAIVPHVHGQERRSQRSVPEGRSRLEPVRVGHRVRASIKAKLVLREGALGAVSIGRVECEQVR